MIHFDNISATVTGVGQVRFFANNEVDVPLLAIGFCREGAWTIPVPLLAACAEQAIVANCRLGFGGIASPSDPPALASIVFQCAEDVEGYYRTAWRNAPSARVQLHCVVGNNEAIELHNFAGHCLAAHWNAAMALLRLLVPGTSLVGYDLADAIDFLSGKMTWCETWRLEEGPTTRAFQSEAVWLGFSNRLLVTEIDAAARAVDVALPNVAQVYFHAGAETTPTLQVDALLAKTLAV